MEHVAEENDDEGAQEFAIVGLWKLNEIKEFYCYQHFRVPNPMKRVLRKDQDTFEGSKFKMFDFLYTSMEKVFFFYLEDNKPNRMKIAYINFDKEGELDDDFMSYKVQDSRLKKMLNHFMS